jgi:hypothetical protein
MKKVFAIVFTLLMLTSSVGITIATHYCNGKAVKTALSLGLADVECDMADRPASCGKNDHSSALNKKNCCANDLVQVTVEDYTAPAVMHSSPDFHFVAALATVYYNLYDVQASPEVRCEEYSPPLPDRNIQVMLQSFLI